MNGINIDGDKISLTINDTFYPVYGKQKVPPVLLTCFQSEGVAFVWKTARMTFPGGFPGRGKIVRPKKKSNWPDLYAKESEILPVNSLDCLLSLAFL